MSSPNHSPRQGSASSRSSTYAEEPSQKLSSQSACEKPKACHAPWFRKTATFRDVRGAAGRDSPMPPRRLGDFHVLVNNVANDDRHNARMDVTPEYYDANASR